MRKLLLFAKLQTLLLTGILLVFTGSIFAQNNGQGLLWLKNPGTNDIYKNPVMGNIGIGTQTPAEKLHIIGNAKIEGQLIADTMKISRIQPVDGDSIIAFGRHTIYWNVNQNNIRWDVTSGPVGFSIGNGLSGNPCQALGLNSMAFGFGAQTTVSGAFSVALGAASKASGNRSMALGRGTLASGNFSTAIGDLASSSGLFSMAFGLNASASGDYSMALGAQSSATTNSATALGYGSKASGISSMALGNSTTTNGTNSIALGNNLTTSATNAFVIGTGITSGTPNSLMVGFGTPTLFVQSSPARVGVAITTPLQTLDVNGTANIRTVAQNNALTQVLVRDPSNFGLIQYRDAATLTGLIGVTGATGATGISGTNGSNGSTGGTGATGTNGTNGTNGSTGSTGSTGINGTNGTNGATGSSGATGSNGTNGSTGSTGAIGATGSGSTGATGSIGATGVIGTTGAVGATGSGSTGATGSIGATGIVGATGAVGATGSGSTGATGEIGATGIVGATGAVGATGSGSTGATGPAGAVGPTGSDLGTHWTITGNAATTASTSPIGTTVNNNFIGTTDAKDFVVATDNLERMRVKSGGNVGIGTTSPSAILEIKKSNPAMVINSTAAIADASILIKKNGTSLWAFGSNVGNSTENFQFYNYTTGTVNLSLNQSTGYVGIGTTLPAYKLDVTGDARVTGQMAIGTTPNGTYSLTIQNGAFSNFGTWAGSDIQLKKDTSSFTDGLNIIKQIRPINYRYNGKTGVTDTNQLCVSVIAQQLQTIAPYAIKPYFARLNNPNDTTETPVELLSINTQPLLFASINAIKELAIKDSINNTKIKTIEANDSINTALNNTQQQSIDSLSTIITSLQNQLSQLSSMINDCCNGNGNGQGNHGNNLMPSGTNNYKSITQTTLTDVELSNKNIVVLNQNVPNPFAEQTTISYYLPDNVQRAQILFFEQSGKIIKTVDLTEKGKGQLNVFANDLSNGIYTYTLIVDGQTVETKKMVKAK